MTARSIETERVCITDLKSIILQMKKNFQWFPCEFTSKTHINYVCLNLVCCSVDGLHWLSLHSWSLSLVGDSRCCCFFIGFLSIHVVYHWSGILNVDVFHCFSIHSSGLSLVGDFGCLWAVLVFFLCGLSLVGEPGWRLLYWYSIMIVFSQTARWSVAHHAYIYWNGK